MRVVLPGYLVEFVPSPGDKTTRLLPFSAAQTAKTVHLIRDGRDLPA